MSSLTKINDCVRFSQDVDSSYADFITIYADLVFREKTVINKSHMNNETVKYFKQGLADNIYNSMLDVLGISQNDLSKLKLVNEISREDLHHLLIVKGLICHD